MILSIDFDGVIHDRENPVKGKRMGKPMQGAGEAIEQLIEDGHTVIVHTVMATTPSGTKAVQDWLEYYDIPHHGVTAIKPQADVYLDDRAIRFTNWQDALRQLSEKD